MQGRTSFSDIPLYQDLAVEHMRTAPITEEQEHQTRYQIHMNDCVSHLFRYHGLLLTTVADIPAIKISKSCLLGGRLLDGRRLSVNELHA